jgi:hypothetical protein
LEVPSCSGKVQISTLAIDDYCYDDTWVSNTKTSTIKINIDIDLKVEATECVNTPIISLEPANE